MTTAGIAVSLRDVSKAYGTVEAVAGVSLDVADGEFFTLLGASGSGKTTTLRLIGGFEHADSGRVFIGDDDVTGTPAHRRNVHTVFQDYGLFPHLDVFENVAFGLRVKKVKNAEIEERVAAFLALVKLTGLEKRLPSELSGGQRQRVALARSLIGEPKVLLLDEPLSALDAKIRVELREELKRVQRRTGITFVYVTHDQEEALAVSDRVAVMEGGDVRQVGTPEDIYQEPVDLFVAQFIGRANFLSGVMVGEEEGLAVVDIEGCRALGRPRGRLRPGDRVRVMVRPENVSLVGAEDLTRARSICSGFIQQRQYVGFADEYIVESGDDLIRVLNMMKDDARAYAEGEKVGVAWDGTRALVFAAE